jgi:hypothetical protein
VSWVCFSLQNKKLVNFLPSMSNDSPLDLPNDIEGKKPYIDFHICNNYKPKACSLTLKIETWVGPQR